MKNILSRLPKKLLVFATAVISLLVVTSMAMATFGPDRPTKAYLGDGTSGFDHVTFDSFTGVPNVGDERDFLRGKLNGTGNLVDPVTGAKDGDTVKVYVYVHNGADPSLNASGAGVAKDLTVRVAIPDAINTTQEITGYISASNAQPKEIYDTLAIKSDKVYAMKFVSGSAKLTTNAFTAALSDNIVKDGVLIGDDALDGVMNGCFEYSGWVTFEVKISVVEKPQEPTYECTALTPVVDPSNKYKFNFTTTVKMSGDVTVNKYVYDFGVQGESKLSTDKAKVTKIYDKPGKYDSTVEVVFNVGDKQYSDSCEASVSITEQPPELPNTGPEGVIAGLFGTGALGYGVVSFRASREELRKKILNRK